MSAIGTFKILGPTEQEIMQILWEEGRGTVRSVYEQVLKRRRIAYTTVMTTMARLAEKGILVQEGKRTPGYIYTPRLTKDELMVQVMRQMVMDLHPNRTERRGVLQALGATMSR